MEIVRHFVVAEDERIGEGVGLQPLWVPQAAGFNPGDALSVMHDALEHRLSDRGRFWEEVRAFGAIVALRYDTGLALAGMNDREAAGLASEILDLMTDHCRHHRELLDDLDTPNVSWALGGDPGPACMGREHARARDFLRAITGQFMQKLERTHPDVLRGDKDRARVIGARFERNLILGFREANRAYGGYMGRQRIAGLAIYWSSSGRGRRDVDETLIDCSWKVNSIVRVCFSENNVKLRLVLNEATSVMRPAWVRQRLYWWANARV